MLHGHRARPARTYCGSPERLKTEGVLAGAASCGRIQKWGYGGGTRLGFKLKVGRHLAHRLYSEDNSRPHRKERGERTLAGGPGEGAMWVCIENWRFWQYS